MTLLFSREGRESLDTITRSGRVLCAFDFDGTLAPIVPKPEDARLPAEIRGKLMQLIKLAPIAIITGRSVEDIRSRLDFDADFVLGNHGIEGLPGWEQRALQFKHLCAEWDRQIRQQLMQATALRESIELENKRYSLSVHYRRAPEPKVAAAMLEGWFASLAPQPHVISGKFVYNLLPPAAGNKGTALTQLMEMTGARSVIYVGDDVTDEDVFRLSRPDVLSIRVEHSENSAAQFYLAQFQDMGPFLDELAARLRDANVHNWIRLKTAANG